MSMTPSEDEQMVRKLLSAPDRWRNQPETRQAAEVRVGLAQARATRAQSILTYLTADRSGWPAELDQMLRSELGIDDLPTPTDEMPMTDDAAPPLPPPDAWAHTPVGSNLTSQRLQYEDEQFGT